MPKVLRIVAALGVAALTACAPAAQKHPARVVRVDCAARAAQIIAHNDAAIAARQYATASRGAETAARVSLACGDRWRAGNELIVAAELAHQNGDRQRARSLLHEGFQIMRSVRVRANDVTASLLAERLSSAQRDMRGSWALW